MRVRARACVRALAAPLLVRARSAGPAAMADDSFAVRDKVAAFATYEDYLESQISETDHFYLESEDVAR